MDALGLRRGYVVYPGTTDYSLGGDVTAISAASLLRQLERVSSL